MVIAHFFLRLILSCAVIWVLLLATPLFRLMISEGCSAAHEINDELPFEEDFLASLDADLAAKAQFLLGHQFPVTLTAFNLDPFVALKVVAVIFVADSSADYAASNTHSSFRAPPNC